MTFHSSILKKLKGRTFLNPFYLKATSWFITGMELSCDIRKMSRELMGMQKRSVSIIVSSE